MIPFSAKGRAMLALSVAFVLAMIVFGVCHRTPTPIPPKEGKTVDSLKATAPDYTARRDTLIKHETTYVAISRQNRLQAAKSAASADSLRRLAIAAEARAQAATDSVSALVQWRAAAIGYHAEADSLRSAVHSLDSALTAQVLAHAAADARADEAERRLLATADLAGRLAKDLQRADPPCRIAFVAKCPSRKTVAVIVAATTYLVSRADVRRATTRALHDGLQAVLP